MYSKIGQSIAEEKASSPQVGSYRLRTGSRDFPNEIPLPLKISSKDIQMDVRVLDNYPLNECCNFV
jgi:hypothetical protein